MSQPFTRRTESTAVEYYKGSTKISGFRIIRARVDRVLGFIWPRPLPPAAAAAAHAAGSGLCGGVRRNGPRLRLPHKGPEFGNQIGDCASLYMSDRERTSWNSAIRSVISLH